MAPQIAHISDAPYAKHKTNLDLSILKSELESEIQFGLFFSRGVFNNSTIEGVRVRMCGKVLDFTFIKCEQTLQPISYNWDVQNITKQSHKSSPAVSNVKQSEQWKTMCSAMQRSSDDCAEMGAKGIKLVGDGSAQESGACLPASTLYPHFKF